MTSTTSSATASTLNPAVMPFFPRGTDDEYALGRALLRDHDSHATPQDAASSRSTTSSVNSLSSSEYRSATSSPGENSNRVPSPPGSTDVSLYNESMIEATSAIYETEPINPHPLPPSQSVILDVGVLGTCDMPSKTDDGSAHVAQVDGPADGSVAVRVATEDSGAGETASLKSANGHGDDDLRTPNGNLLHLSTHSMHDAVQTTVDLPSLDASVLPRLGVGSQPMLPQLSAPTILPASQLGVTPSQLPHIVPEISPLAFESMLKASPTIHNVMDRLARYEQVQRDVLRELGEVRHQLKLINDRSRMPFPHTNEMRHQQQQSPPEFRDPFAPNNQTFSPRSSFSVAPNQLGPPNQLGNIAAAQLGNITSNHLATQLANQLGSLTPNQLNSLAAAHSSLNTRPSEDGPITQRLSNLTASVGQFLQLHDQQLSTNGNTVLDGTAINNVSLSPSVGGGGIPISINASVSNPPPGSAINVGQPSSLGSNNSSAMSAGSPPIDLLTNQLMAHGLPPRGTPDLRGPTDMGMRGSTELNLRGELGLRGPAPRMPNVPTRTWSVGALDLSGMRASEGNIRLGESGGLGLRGNDFNRFGGLDMGLNNPILRKRGSVAGLARRDSVGVIDPHAAEYGGSREAGPIISKWDQLAISPELLRSLNKFGVGPPNKIQQRALPFLLRGADIIAQAPPTQERIAAYVIPAIQIAVTTPPAPTKWPLAILISTTVDQATQAQRMIRDLGGPIGIRSALGVGTVSLGSDIAGELRGLQQTRPHIVCGTPQKLHALFTSSGGLPGSEVRFLVLDEVDQLIARNLHDFVYNLVKVLPPSRSRPLSSAPATSTPASAQNTGTSSSLFSPSPFDPAVLPSAPGHSSPPTTSDAVSIASEGSKASEGGASTPAVERQTALFSNTVPQDVLNLASNLHLLEPVRVLVRRDGNVTHADANQGSRGLRQFYLYLAFQAGGGRASSTPSNGLGIIGSGRASVAASAETTQAREWKLEALLDIFEDVDVSQAVVHVGGMTNLDAVVHKLALRGIEGIPMHGDMTPPNKIAALTKFRTNTSLTRSHSGFMVAPHAGAPLMRPPPQMKVLVVYDVQVKAQEVSHIPLIINYDLPKAVEEYAHRVAPAVAPNYARAGVVVNFVTASGGDVEMLRSIECFYKIKCPEVPMSLREIV